MCVCMWRSASGIIRGHLTFFFFPKTGLIGLRLTKQARLAAGEPQGSSCSPFPSTGSRAFYMHAG